MNSRDYLRWTQLPYSGELYPPTDGVTPEAGSWPMFFISRRGQDFIDPFGQVIQWNIKNPNLIDWQSELQIVKQTLQNLTPQQIQIAYRWGTGEVSKQLIPIIYNMMETYGIASTRAARLLGFYHAAINDAFVIAWYFKYLWDVARPCQYDRNLKTVLFTPRFPTYPSAHAVMAGCSESILSYYFPQERHRLHEMFEECAMSREYAGVHFKVDNDEGLKLGRQLGQIVVNLIIAQNIR
ncbi:vanadium-dependent haloperoxidase [Fictibacillus phosphorivorans]|uniref:vanadium-dependent haloperoxidase n=1 Tax=Fictibacillus phosphorivorans TaxID=1221500 RepID=UPI00203D7772|nr:vanadium-dependent haloperoxidase [Fictibacillus phosphorivorans]MCM3717344.1 vanadium-dependent haloperoxidase [Fictibacillus phosphorivorans]MCM3775039.1 vanadium-dependent haloperoxidase [Fictibacillus phosphorivorans]